MKLLTASVISNTDIYQAGRFIVSSTSFTGPRSCIYTSPFGGLHNPIDGQKAGFFAIPSIGQTVLIAQTDDVGGDNYYLISVVHDIDTRSDGDSIPVVARSGPVPKELYDLYPGSPQKVVIRDAYSNRLVLSHAYAPEKNKEVNRAELIGSKGKKLSLDESPLVNRISLENEYRDGFYLTSDISPISPDMGERHMILRTVGMMQHLSELGIEMIVTEGTELTISNESTGINSGGAAAFGNVNLRSKFKDINITSDGETGNILIRSLGSDGVIQLNSNGDIIIKTPSDKNVYIESGNINIKAEETLNLEAQNVYIKGNNATTISGGGSSVLDLTPSDASLGGTLVNLAPPTPLQAPNGAETRTAIQNDYGE